MRAPSTSLLMSADQAPKRPEKPSPSQSPNPQQLGAVMLGSTLTGLLLGLGVDHWFGTAPWGVLCCSLAFMGAGFYQLIKASR
jgi:F0F1-type ATP synthase assembly protein I